MTQIRVVEFVPLGRTDELVTVKYVDLADGVGGSAISHVKSHAYFPGAELEVEFENRTTTFKNGTQKTEKWIKSRPRGQSLGSGARVEVRQELPMQILTEACRLETRACVGGDIDLARLERFALGLVPIYFAVSRELYGVQVEGSKDSGAETPG